MIKTFDKFHKTKAGYLIFAFVELAIAYGFISLAIDRGNLWYYLLTLVFLVGFLQNLIKLIGKLIHGEPKRRKA
jgi:4-hydroxybenzoate polyprenyltransferase